MHQIKYCPELGFLHVEFTGMVNVDGILAFYRELVDNSMYPSRIKILSDFRRADSVDYELKNMMKLIAFAQNQFPKRFEHVRWSNLSLKPIHTTGAFVFSTGLSTPHIEYNFFTTYAAAMASLFQFSEEARKINDMNFTNPN